MVKYRTKPFDAERWDGDHRKLDRLGLPLRYASEGSQVIKVDTKLGTILVKTGDWIIRFENGDHWVVEQDPFELYYEPVED